MIVYVFFHLFVCVFGDGGGGGDGSYLIQWLNSLLWDICHMITAILLSL